MKSSCFIKCVLSVDDMKKKSPPVEEGEVLRPLTKCYTSIEVSSNKMDFSRLGDKFILNSAYSTCWSVKLVSQSVSQSVSQLFS